MANLAATGAIQSNSRPESRTVGEAQVTWRLHVLVCLGVWSVVSAVLVFKGYEEILTGAIRGNDDAMRLVQVRDFLAGQSWFDLTQYRLNPPDGVWMHWSRLIDAPLGGMILAFKSIADQRLAEQLTLIIWPLLLLLCAIAAAGRAAFVLSGRAAAIAAIIIMPTTLVTLTQFMSGRLDHHNIQIVLTVLLLGLVMELPVRLGSAFGAGLVMALMMAIGLETLPYLLIVPAAIACVWIATGPAIARSMIVFGLALAISSVGMFVSVVPSDLYTEIACDAFSLPFVSLFGVGGLALAVLGVLTRGPVASNVWMRGCLAIAAGGAVTAVIAINFPACLSGPYGDLNPRLIELWLSEVREARNIWQLVLDTPDRVLAFYGFPVVAFLVGIWALKNARAEDRYKWIVLNAFVLTGLVVACWQIRGLTFANMLAVPAAAWLIGDVWRRSRNERDRARRFLHVLAAALVMNSGFYMVLADAMSFMKPEQELRGGREACIAPNTLKQLSVLPAGTIVSFIDLGSHILAQSSHRVMAAPYHRNQRGNLLVFNVMMSDPSNARELANAGAADYLVYCEGMGDYERLAAAAPDGLLAQLQAGQTFEWLEPVSVDESGPLRIFRILNKTGAPITPVPSDDPAAARTLQRDNNQLLQREPWPRA